MSDFSGGYEVPTLNNTYTKTQIDNFLLLKSDKSTTYNKNEIDNALALKANTSAITTPDIASWSSGTSGYRYLDTGGAGLVIRTGINDSAMQILGSENTGSVGKVIFCKNVDVGNISITGNASGITKAMVGLGNVDNTNDLNKPISTATQTALNLKQNIINNLTGTGETLLESNFIKRIFTVSPLEIKTYLNINDGTDAKNGNIELSLNKSALFGQLYHCGGIINSDGSIALQKGIGFLHQLGVQREFII